MRKEFGYRANTSQMLDSTVYVKVGRWWKFSITGLRMATRVKEANLISAPSLLPFFCASPFIPPNVVMSVCRRCVERVHIEMGRKAGIGGESYLSEQDNAHIFPRVRLFVFI